MRFNFFTKVLIILIMFVIIIAIVDIQVKMSELNNQKNELQIEIDKTSDKVEEIKIKLKTPFDEQYMEKLAREKLKYRSPSDILFTNDMAD